MFNFFHRLMNPHCEHCHNQELENKVCQSCDTLQQENHRLILANERLLAALIDKNVPKPEPATDMSEIKPIHTGRMSFRQQKQILEAESRESARILRNRIQEIEAEVYQIPKEELVPVVPLPPSEPVLNNTEEDNEDVA